MKMQVLIMLSMLRDELTNIYNKFQSVLSNFNIPFQEKKNTQMGCIMFTITFLQHLTTEIKKKIMT